MRECFKGEVGDNVHAYMINQETCRCLANLVPDRRHCGTFSSWTSQNIWFQMAHISCIPTFYTKTISGPNKAKYGGSMGFSTRGHVLRVSFKARFVQRENKVRGLCVRAEGGGGGIGDFFKRAKENLPLIGLVIRSGRACAPVSCQLRLLTILDIKRQILVSLQCGGYSVITSTLSTDFNRCLELDQMPHFPITCVYSLDVQYDET